MRYILATLEGPAIVEGAELVYIPETPDLPIGPIPIELQKDGVTLQRQMISLIMAKDAQGEPAILIAGARYTPPWILLHPPCLLQAGETCTLCVAARHHPPVGSHTVRVVDSHSVPPAGPASSH